MAAAAPPPAGPAWKVWVGGLVALVVLVGVVGWAWQRVSRSAQATVQAQPTPTSAPTQTPWVVTATPRPATATPAPTVTPAQPTATTEPMAQPTATATVTAQATPSGVESGAAPAVGLPPQPQVTHPTLYMETGVGNTRTWTIQGLAGTTIIAGGVCVDSVCDGRYKAWSGDTTRTVSVVDGFALQVQNQWANEEFCFRVNQAKQFGWAHTHIEPLAGWQTCPEPLTAASP